MEVKILIQYPEKPISIKVNFHDGGSVALDTNDETTFKLATAQTGYTIKTTANGSRNLNSIPQKADKKLVKG